MSIHHLESQKIKFQKRTIDLKDQAHFFFDKIWKNGYMKRDDAYLWLARYLGVEEPKAHMRGMDRATCKKVIEGSIMILNDMRRLDLDFGDEINHPHYELDDK